MIQCIELSNVSFNNKGDQLMVEAILQDLNQRIKNCEYCIPFKQSNDEIINKYGFKQSLRLDPNKSENFRQNFEKTKESWILFCLKKYIPSFLLRILGYVQPNNVQVVIDVSGFFLSDHWGRERALNAKNYYNSCKKLNQKIILMPKTFGPFTDPVIADATSEIISVADLVFCRDIESYNHLKSINVKSEKLKLAPDYTGAIRGVIPSYSDKLKGRVAIIPNFRMIDKTNKNESEEYLQFIKNVCVFCKKNNRIPFFVFHQDVDDVRLVPDIEKVIGDKIEFIVESDPILLKGLIGQCEFIVSSRLHGIINGLSQGIPVLGTGWSHKYKSIFSDYHCPELLIQDVGNKDELHEKLKKILQPEYFNRIKVTVSRAQEEITVKNNEMWDLISEKIVGD